VRGCSQKVVLLSLLSISEPKRLLLLLLLHMDDSALPL
jgi:hypothetical protein